MKESDTFGGIFPVRHEYGPGEELPDFVDLSFPLMATRKDAPGWTIAAGADPVWSHVAAMGVEWSDDAGHWVPVRDNGVQLIVTCVAGERFGDRHPELDRKWFPDAASAYRAAWDAGLLKAYVFPPRNAS